MVYQVYHESTLGAFQFSNAVYIFYLVLAVFLSHVYRSLRILVNSPFGQVLIGITRK